MSYVDQTRTLLNVWLQQQARKHAEMLAWCDSPIERMFLSAMLCCNWEAPSDVDRVTIGEFTRANFTECAPGELSTCLGPFFFSAFVQPSIDLGRPRPSRLDFAFISRFAKVAVELDGHAFHERTKEQAARDKSRDRALQAKGWSVLRFTGSEIFADPIGRYKEVARYLNRLTDRWHGDEAAE